MRRPAATAAAGRAAAARGPQRSAPAAGPAAPQPQVAAAATVAGRRGGDAISGRLARQWRPGNGGGGPGAGPTAAARNRGGSAAAIAAAGDGNRGGTRRTSERRIRRLAGQSDDHRQQRYAQLSGATRIALRSGTQRPRRPRPRRARLAATAATIDGDWRQRPAATGDDWNRGWRNDSRYEWQRLPLPEPQPVPAVALLLAVPQLRLQPLLDRPVPRPLFFDQRYWIGDPYHYRLPPAPYGTQWVRYYNDVLLVDVYTGEVIDVIYDFFW